MRIDDHKSKRIEANSIKDWHTHKKCMKNMQANIKTKKLKIDTCPII